MELNDLDKKVLEAAKKHPSFNKNKALKELAVLKGCDVVQDLYVLYQKTGKDESGSTNILGSCLAWYMGITSCEPDCEFKLAKRRTYGRAGFPDIDMDFDYLRRTEIIDYLIEKYGRAHVGSIGTVQRLKTKAALRRVIKVLDPTGTIVFRDGKIDKNIKHANFELENTILRCLPSMMRRDDGTFIKTVEEACGEFAEFRRHMEAHPEVRKFASAVEGGISAYGCLAADTVVKTNEGQSRIDEIDVSVKVAYINRNGKIRYTSNFYAHKTGKKKCYKMKISSGDWIKVTDEHLIFTDQGCVFFEKIRKEPKKYKVYAIK